MFCNKKILFGIYLESINKDICIMFRILACFYFVGTCQILFIQCNIPHTFFQAKIKIISYREGICFDKKINSN